MADVNKADALEHERGARRSRRALAAMATSLMARALTASASLLVTPLVFARLGKEQYGVWVSIGSLMLWLSLVDLGLPRRLENETAAALGRDDASTTRALAATTFALALAVAVAVAAVGAVAAAFIPWPAVLGSDDVPADVMLTAVRAALFVTCAALVVAPAWALFAGLQRAWQANLLAAGGVLVGIAALFALTRRPPSSDAELHWFIIAIPAAGVGAGVVGWLALLVDGSASLSPSLVTRALVGKLVHGALPFMVLQLAALAINESPVLSLASFHGAQTAADYGVFVRIFMLLAFIMNVIDVPYVAAYREAWVRGSHAWLRRQFAKVLALKMLAVVALGAALVVFGNDAAALLSDGAVSLERHVWVLGAALLVVSAWNGAFLHLFSVFDKMRELMLTVTVNGAVTIALIIALAHSYAIPGAIAGSAAFSLAVGTWWMPWLLRRELRQLFA